MAGVAAALETNNNIGIFRQNIGDFAFSFVAPAGADNCFYHNSSSLSNILYIFISSQSRLKRRGELQIDFCGLCFGVCIAIENRLYDIVKKNFGLARCAADILVRVYDALELVECDAEDRVVCDALQKVVFTAL